MKQTAHYVDNEQFTQAIKEFCIQKENNSDLTLREFEHGEFIGACFMKICTNLSNRSNFNRYTYKDEMILDAIENCLKATKNFTVEKSANAFGYFTMVATNAFIRRIKREKRNLEKRHKYLSDTKSVNEEVAKQFAGAPAGSEHASNVQHFVEQVHSMLAENDQLYETGEIKEKAQKNKKEKTSDENNLSQFIK